MGTFRGAGCDEAAQDRALRRNAAEKQQSASDGRAGSEAEAVDRPGQGVYPVHLRETK